MPHAGRKILEEAAIIKHASVFLGYIKLKRVSNQFQSGTYFLSPADSYAKITHVLQGRDGVATVRVVIPEGTSIRQWAEILERHGLGTATDIQAFAKHRAKSFFKQEYPFLADIPTDNIEGYLYPDTYLFPKDAPLPLLFKLPLQQFSRRIYHTWLKQQKNTKQPKQSLHKILTLASLCND